MKSRHEDDSSRASTRDVKDTICREGVIARWRDVQYADNNLL